MGAKIVYTEENLDDQTRNILLEEDECGQPQAASYHTTSDIIMNIMQFLFGYDIQVRKL